jgi:hypothetical protein
MSEPEKIGIILGNIPNEWIDNLKRLVATHDDLELVAETVDQLQLLVLAKEHNADAIVLSRLPDGREPGICSHLLTHCPNILLLLLPLEPGPGLVLRNRPSREELHDLSINALLAVLRRVEG